MKSLASKKSSKKILYIIIAVGITLAGGAYYIFVLNGSILGWPNRVDQNQSINLKPASDAEIEDGQEAKKNTIDKDQSIKQPEESKKDNDATEAESNDSFTVSVTASNKTEQSFQVRVLISQIVANGTCSISLTRTSSPSVTKTAKTQSLASNSTCEGFDIPLSELSTGAWNYTITVTDTTGKASSANGTVEI